MKVSSTSPILAPQDVVPTPPQSPSSRQLLPLSVSQDAAKTWSSPAFLKRKSLAQTSFFESVYDTLIDADGDGDDRPRKKARFGRRSDQWTFLERTPSPEGESVHEDLEDSHQSVQIHSHEEPVVSTTGNASAVGTGDLLNTIDYEVVTQNPSSPLEESQIEPPALFAAGAYNETSEVSRELPLVLPAVSDKPLSLEHGTGDIVHFSENSEHGNARVSDVAPFENDNNEGLEKLSEANRLKEPLPSQFHECEEERVEVSNESTLLCRSDAQEQHLYLETNEQEVSTTEILESFTPDEDIHRPSAGNATSIPVSNFEHCDIDSTMILRLRPSEHETHDEGSNIETPVELEHGLVTVPSDAHISGTGERLDLEIFHKTSIYKIDIRNLDARSNGSSQSDMGEDSVLEDESDAIDTDHEVDEASSIETEKEVDYFGGRTDERENTVDSLAEVRCEGPAEVGATAFDRAGKTTDLVNVDSGGDAEEALLDDEDNDSGVSEYEQIDLLEHPAEVLNNESEDSEGSYESGEESVVSSTPVGRSILEHHDRDVDSEVDSDSYEDVELVDSENDGQTSILEYSAIPANESFKRSEGSQRSVQDDLMSLVDAAGSMAEHDHITEDNGAEHSSNEDTEVPNLENDDQKDFLDDPDEPPRRGPDDSQHSNDAEAMSLEPSAIAKTGHGHRYGDEEDIPGTPENGIIVDLTDNRHLNILELRAEISYKGIDQSLTPNIDQARISTRAAKSVTEYDRRDVVDEEPGSDVDEESAELGDEDQLSGQDDSVVSSDAKGVVFSAKLARSVADNSREDSPDSQSYSALARDAILEAELQEGITMDEALQLPLEQPSNPLEDHTEHQELKEDRDSGQVLHDSGRSERNLPFPFTPQPSGLSTLYPNSGIILDRPNVYHQSVAGVIVNPTSSFSLPDYDSVQDGFDVQPGEQLITPLATQRSKPEEEEEEEEEEEMQSQLELDFEDELSNGRVDNLVDDDTIPLPLPVTDAASRSLEGILRNLGRESEIRATEYGNDDFSGRTEPWSDASANRADPRKEERRSPRSSGSIANSVDQEDDTDAKSRELSPQHDIVDWTEIQGDLSRHSIDRILLQTSQLGLRTQFSYFAPLSTIEQHFNSTVDVLSTVVSSTKASRAIKGPRDYYQTILIVDSSALSVDTIPSCSIAQIFRPYKEALPILQPGDTLLLRNFKVQMQKHKPMLLSTENSAWAVFCQDTDVQIRGPHVEYGEEEVEFARTLAEWWHSLGSEVQSQLASSVPQIEPKSRGRPKGKKKEKRVSEVVHELRDGTKYTDGSADMNSIHELRDGTMYADDGVS